MRCESYLHVNAARKKILSKQYSFPFTGTDTNRSEKCFFFFSLFFPRRGKKSWTWKKSSSREREEEGEKEGTEKKVTPHHLFDQ